MTADVELGNKQLLQGQRLFAFVNAANRDPEQFADSDRFDIGRSPNAHLTFGQGIHFCLGAPLAKLEGQIALRSLIERFPGIALATTVAPEWTTARSPRHAVAPGAFALIRRKLGS